MLRLSSRYKIVPICENPDYFIYYKNNLKDKWNTKTNLPVDDRNDNMTNRLKVVSNDKSKSDEYWKVKTDKNAVDFDICEELILTDEIDITKYVKRVYVSSFEYRKGDKIIHQLEKMCKEHGIDIVSFESIRNIKTIK